MKRTHQLAPRGSRRQATLLAFLIFSLTVMPTTTALTTSTGGGGIESAGLGLDGAGVNIGHVEPRRVSLPGFDSAIYSHSDLVPAGVFTRATAAVADDNLANCPNGTCSFNTCNGGANDGMRCWHPQKVGGVMVSNQSIHMGVSPAADLHSSGTRLTGSTNNLLISAQQVATQAGDDVRAINLSVGLSGTLDTQSVVTLGIDWATRKHETLFVKSGGNTTGTTNSIPRDAYNALVVSATTAIPSGPLGQNVFEVAWSGNDYGVATDGRRLTQILAPGNGVTSTTMNDQEWNSTGTSIAAPHAVGTVALLQQYANARIPGSASGWDADARRPDVMKAVLLNSAEKVVDAGDGNRLGMEKQITDSNSADWLASDAASTSTLPLDDQLGVGQLNAKRAWIQFAGGEQDEGNVGNIGWDTDVVDGLTDTRKYILDQALDAGSFISTTVTWERNVNLSLDADNDNNYDLGDQFTASPLGNLNLYVMPAGAVNIGQAVCTSDSPNYNIEHIFCPIPTTGNYEIWVQRDTPPGGPFPYAVAWWSRGTDCNANGIPDDHDIAIGLADDCNANGTPDSCAGDTDPFQEAFFTFTNDSGQPAADLHVTVTGTGGSVSVNPNDVAVSGDVTTPGCVQPAVTSNPPAATTTIVIDWGESCVDENASVTFRACAPGGEPVFDNGFWSGPGGSNIGNLDGSSASCTVAGACCSADGACSETDMTCCDGLGGTFSAGDDCATLGGCCVDGDTCLDTSEDCCVAAGGVFDANSECADTGSCTVGSDCSTTTEACCTAAGGAFTQGGTCPEDECDPGFGTGGGSRATEPFEALHALAERYQPGKSRPTSSPNRGGPGITATAAAGTLTVTGTPGVDEIAVRIAGSNIRVEELQGGLVNGQVGGDTIVGGYTNISIDPGDGNDLVVLDDSNGSVAAAYNITMMGTSGDNTLLGATGPLSIGDVVNRMAQMQTAQNLITMADTLIRKAGAIQPVGQSGDDIITTGRLLVENAVDGIVVPAAEYVGDVPDALIQPTADYLAEGKDDLMPGAIGLVHDAYNGLVQEGYCLAGDVCTGDATPADFDSGKLNALQVDAELIRDQGQGLINEAQIFQEQCDPLFQNQAQTLVAQLNELEALLESVLDPAAGTPCPEEPDDPARGGGITLPPYCPASPVARGGTPAQCVLDAEAIVECMTFLAENFGVVGVECEFFANQLLTNAQNYDLAVETVFLPTADQYVADADNLVLTADALDLQGINLEALGEDFALRAETELGDAGATMESRGESEIGNAASALDAQAEADFAILTSDLEDLATSLADAAQALIDANLQDLDAAGLTRGIGTSCNNIVTTNTIIGGPGPNILLGTFGNDLMIGGGGVDLLIGLSGDDIMMGDSGLDLLFGGSGTNEMYGGDGIDLLVGGNEIDCMFGEDGIDIMLGRGGNDEMDGGDKTDVMLGMDGRDDMAGSQGIDVMLGGQANDSADGGNCPDVILGGMGADTLTGDNGILLKFGSTVSIDLGDLIFGQQGADTIYGDDAASTGTGIDVIFGGDDPDDIFGANGGTFKAGNFQITFGNVIFGGPGGDEIDSRSGIDVMFGGSEPDVMTAGNGDNLEIGSNFSLDLGNLMFGNDGNDTMTGGDGIDVAFGGRGDDTIAGMDGGLLVAGSFNFKFGNVLFGQQNNDELSGLEGVDLLFGGVGADDLRGGNGFEIQIGSNFTLNFGDLLFGSEGQDTLYGDAPTDTDALNDDGFDLLFGGDANDVIYAGEGGLLDVTTLQIQFGNLIFGSQGDDMLFTGYPADPNTTGIDFIFGGTGNDTINGGDGGNFQIGNPAMFQVDWGELIFGSQGNDTITSGSGFDLVFCGTGDDGATTGTGIDLVFGSSEDDVIDGGDGGTITLPIAAGAPAPIPFGNILFGGDNEDDITSGGTATEIDLIFGNDCDDMIDAGDGLLDLVFGNKGDDDIEGQAGIDLIFGNRGNDRILAGGGLVDIVFGNRGNDDIQGEADIDLLFGNRDDDIVDAGSGIFDLAFGNDGSDTVRGAGGIDLLFGNKEGDIVEGGSDLDIAFGNADGDRVDGGSGIDLLFGNKGTDRMIGGLDLDLMFGNDGADDMEGGDSPDIMFGNGGNDVMRGDNSNDFMFGNANDDKISGGPNTDFLFGNSGNDVVDGEGNTDFLFGNSGRDWIYGGDSRDFAFGNDHNDTLLGEEGRDILLGNAGDDRIEGGVNGDILIGNSGDDKILGNYPTDNSNQRDIVIGNSDDDTVEGGDDDPDSNKKDYVFGNGGSDNLWGCPEKDRLFGGAGSDNKDKTNCSGINFGNATCGTVSGTKQRDIDGDGVGDAPLSGVVIYLDTDGDAQLDPGERARITNAGGAYSFSGVPAGSYTLREVEPAGTTLTTPAAGGYPLAIGSTSTVSGQAFVNRDECPPDPTASFCPPCASCPANGTLVPISENRCSVAGEACTTDGDCSCGGVCQAVVIDCDCETRDVYAQFDDECYDCSDTLTVTILDPDGVFDDEAAVSTAVTVIVLNGSTEVDRESNLAFTKPLPDIGEYVSETRSISCTTQRDPESGVIDARVGDTIVVEVSSGGQTVTQSVTPVERQCDPDEGSTLDVRPGAGPFFTWASVSGAITYDVVTGSGELLGDFTAAVSGCLANDSTGTVFDASGDPASGQFLFYLVRAEVSGPDGLYESGGFAQVGLRDPQIAASGNDCP